MKQNSKEVFLEFDLQGFKKDDIKIRLSRNSVTIRARNREKKKIQRDDFFQATKQSKNFNYATNLPKINPKKAKIEFKRGTLKIKAPKV